MSLLEEREADITQLTPAQFKAKYKSLKFDPTKGLPAGALLGLSARIKPTFIDDNGVAYKRIEDKMYTFEIPKGQTEAPSGIVKAGGNIYDIVESKIRKNGRTGICKIV